MEKSRSLSRLLLRWLPGAAVVTLLCGLVYGAVQQSFRASANDPQIQLAEDAAARLAGGDSPQAVVPADPLDMARSLAPFLIVFDDAGRPLASSAQLNGATPLPPKGVLEYARTRGQNQLTWQPQPGVRSATVVARFSGRRSGFVLAGRSLREVESRVANLTKLVGLAWVGALALTLAGAFLREKTALRP
jgi:hypothetical protein